MSHDDREKDRRYREANREQINERKRRRRQANPEKAREYDRRYRAANPDKAREQDRRWRQANPEKARERQRRYHEANREQINERNRRWRKANPQQAGQGRYMRRRHGLWPEDWATLWAAQDGRCYLCGDPLPEDGDGNSVHVDHDHRCCPEYRSCSRCRRGLAHNACNTLIGLAGDDPKRLRRIAANLERAKRQVVRRPQPALFDLTDIAGGPAPHPPTPALQ